MDCSPPVSSVHGILQARILQWVAISSSRVTSQSRDRIRVSCISCIGICVLYHQHHLGSPLIAVVVVQSLSCVQLFVTLWTAACQACLSSTIFQSLLKFVPTELVMPSNYLILCCPILLWPSVFLSIRVFSSELALCIGWPKYWICSLSSSPSNEYLALTSFRIDWFDLLAVQGTLKSLLQHHNSKASILQH